jgi:mRNA-degrading endonuclease RelE of RelBE toxin-antitoxin system
VRDDAVLYELTWEPEAIEQLSTLAKTYPDAAAGVIPAVYLLAADPRPGDSTPLGGSGTYRRLQVGHLRIIYAVSELAHAVRIILVGRADLPR